MKKHNKKKRVKNIKPKQIKERKEHKKINLTNITNKIFNLKWFSLYILGSLIILYSFIYNKNFYLIIGAGIMISSTFFAFLEYSIGNLKKKEHIIYHKNEFEIIGILIILVIIYFFYNLRNVVSDLFSNKGILIYIVGIVLVLVIIFFIVFKKIRLPKFKIKKEKKIDDKKSVVAKVNIPLDKYETYLDKLYEWVNEKGSVDIDDIIKKFKISRENAERWGKILEEHGLIKLYYHGLNKISFKKW